MEALFVLLVALFVSGPIIDNGEGPNRCYRVNAQMEQIYGPCRPSETRGLDRTMRPPYNRPEE